MVRRPLAVAFATLLAGCGTGSAPQADPQAAGPSTPPFDAPVEGPSDAGTGGPQPGPTPTAGADAGGLAADAGNGSDAAAPRLRFVAVGDTGKGDDDEAAVGAAIALKCQIAGCDFVLLLGDNVYDSGVTSPTDPQFQTKFEVPFQAVTAPFWVALGNHDYGGNGLGNEFGKAAHQIAYSQRSAKWRMPAAYYRFAQGDAEFFALDTNMQMYGQDAQQKADVKRWLATSTATWKIAFGHHPYRSNGPHGNAGSYDGLPLVPRVNGQGVKDFAEEVYCGRVDLYLSGHDHSRQWLTDTCNGTSLVVSGAGARGTDLDQKNPSLFQSNDLGFLYVVLEGRRLTAEFVHTSGTINYARTILK